MVGVILITLTSCDRNSGLLSKREGEIIYDIEYIENNLSKISVDMMPKKMVTRYRNDAFTFEIDGFFGLFKISNVVNPRESVNRSELTVLSKKFYYEGSMYEPAVGFGMMPEMEFHPTGNTKLICGYECNESLVTFPKDPRTDTLKIYYTKEIPLNNSNISTPYRDIDGVLLELYLQLHKVEMKLTASNVYEKPVSKQVFRKKEGYQKATKEYMEAVLFKLLDTE